jgi:hypothetical protein
VQLPPGARQVEPRLPKRNPNSRSVQTEGLRDAKSLNSCGLAMGWGESSVVWQDYAGRRSMEETNGAEILHQAQAPEELPSPPTAISKTLPAELLERLKAPLPAEAVFAESRQTWTFGDQGDLRRGTSKRSVRAERVACR